MLWAQMFLEMRVVTRRSSARRSGASSLISQYLMACRNGPFGSLGSIYVWHLCSFVLICQIISYYNVYRFAYILTFSIPRTSSTRNMHQGAQSSAQGHAIWTSVSATCFLRLTVPLLRWCMCMCCVAEEREWVAHVLSPGVGVACRWGYFPITCDTILDASSA